MIKNVSSGWQVRYFLKNMMKLVTCNHGLINLTQLKHKPQRTGNQNKLKKHTGYAQLDQASMASNWSL